MLQREARWAASPMPRMSSPKVPAFSSGADQVEPVAGARGGGQGAQGQGQGSEADRHVDGEQPLPGADGENGGRDGGPERGGHADRHGVEADAAAQARAG